MAAYPTLKEFLEGKILPYINPLTQDRMTAEYKRGHGIFMTRNGQAEEPAEVHDEEGASRFYHQAKHAIPKDGSIPGFLEISEEERNKAWVDNPPHEPQRQAFGGKSLPTKKRIVGKRDQFIKMLIKDNPNKGKKSRTQFELLSKSRTVHGFLAQGGLPMWVNHGVRHGWLTLHNEPQK